jgi:hypothetical protein
MNNKGTTQKKRATQNRKNKVTENRTTTAKAKVTQNRPVSSFVMKSSFK